MLDNTAEISDPLNALAKEGLIPTIDELATLSPYQTRHIKRFGNYDLDLGSQPFYPSKSPLSKRRIERNEVYFISKDAFIRCRLAYEKRGVAILNGIY